MRRRGRERRGEGRGEEKEETREIGWNDGPGRKGASKAKVEVCCGDETHDFPLK